MLFLIDGYNLMHAAGVVGRVKAGPLKSARLRLLDWLANAARGRTDTLRVLFDGQAAPAESDEESYRGVQVRFAYRATADDIIEEELAKLPRGGAAVVSDDSRLHEAARRRGCESWGCAQFVDWLIEPHSKKNGFELVEEKPEPGGVDEELLRVFTGSKQKHVK